MPVGGGYEWPANSGLFRPILAYSKQATVLEWVRPFFKDIMPLNESTVEEAALSWFEELGYAVAHGPDIAPGEPAAERKSFGDVVLVGRLREAIGRINPTFPRRPARRPCAKCCALGTPSLVGTNRAFHGCCGTAWRSSIRRKDGSIAGDRVRLIDFDDPAATIGWR